MRQIVRLAGQRVRLEVGVVHSSESCGSFGGVQQQQASHKVQSIGRKSSKQLIELVCGISAPRGIAGSRKHAPARHGLLSGSSHGLEDASSLVNVGRPRKDGLAREHFAKDTADSPHVNGRGVLSVAQNELRRTVPPGDNHAREVLCAQSCGRGCGCRAIKAARKAEISEFEDSGVVDENVGGLDVSMQKLLFVQVANAL